MLKAFVVCLLGLSCMLAHAGENCQHVGGTISTNFLDPSTTFGTVTGDLGGAIGVTVLNFIANPDGSIVLHNQHHWVTTTGDTIFADPADATGIPTGIPGFYAGIYMKGVTVSGGTGRFENASGTLASWGAIDQNKGEVVLRYEGTLCFSKRK